MTILPWVPLILVVLSIIWLFCLLRLYRNKALLLSHELKEQQTVTAAEIKKDQHRETLDNRLRVLHEEHRHETINDQAHLADRNDFDNDWSRSSLPRSGTGSNTSDSGAEPSGSSGIAGDNSG